MMQYLILLLTAVSVTTEAISTDPALTVTTTKSQVSQTDDEQTTFSNEIVSTETMTNSTDPVSKMTINSTLSVSNMTTNSTLSVSNMTTNSTLPVSNMTTNSTLPVSNMTTTLPDSEMTINLISSFPKRKKTIAELLASKESVIGILLSAMVLCFLLIFALDLCKRIRRNSYSARFTNESDNRAFVFE